MSKKSHKITLDKERSLRYNHMALELLEDEGIDVFKLAAMADGAMFSPKQVKLMLWAGLRHEDKKLTIAKATSLMDEADLSVIIETVMKALVDHLGGKA